MAHGGMKMENTVSIWFGKFETEKQFNEFMKEAYDDEGDVHSPFMDAFGISFIEHDLQEILFDENMNKSKIEAASYSETFLDKVEIDFSKYNCIVLLYDFNYNGLIKNANNMGFYGVLNYEK
jgi:hypothetical protein